MSRHRRERVPRHRAQRFAGYPARRAPLTTAVPASGTALDGAGNDAGIGVPAAGATLETSALGGAGLGGAGLAGTGLGGAGLARTGLGGTELGGTELDGTELGGTGLGGTGLGGTGQDATETAPLAALTASSDDTVPGLPGLAASHHGAPNGGASYDGALDDGALDDDVADDAAVLGPRPLGPRPLAPRPPGGRPPSHARQRSRPAASASAGPASAGGLAGGHPGVMRGLLVTPWFAAATGFVIAASLWIYSPHPQLAFPAIKIAPCRSSGCYSPVDPQGAGRLTINSGQPVRHRDKSASPAKPGIHGRTGTAASGLTIGYVVQRTGPDNFQLVISVTGKPALTNWHLAFVLPGDQIQYVFGAHWQAVGIDGGIVSSFTGDQRQQYRSGDYGRGTRDRGPGWAPGQSGVSFTVVASGTRVAPAGCRFNGASCTFRELSGSQGAR